METDPVQTRLSAVLIADVVGYSRLMTLDSEATVSTLAAHRQQLALLISQHGGRIVNAPGDNLLAEFPSALEATRCAVEIQQILDERNIDIDSERRMQWRIGVHLGDLMVKGKDIYGDGVNIAARLEELAEPGGICISGVVHEQVHTRLTCDFEDLGEPVLKNIAHHVRVYRLRLKTARRGGPALSADAPKALRDEIHDFSLLIAEKTRDFVGRTFILDALEQFIQNQPRGYFFLVGDPGVGKSAFAAYFIQKRGCVHHFNIRAEGTNTPEFFLRDVCAQLIVKYELPYTSIPAGATQDARFLKRVLAEVSESLAEGEKGIIVIDALDEVDRKSHPEGTNVLYLPIILPKGIYIFATSRREAMLEQTRSEPPPLRVECEQQIFHIDHTSSENMVDVFDYLEQQVARPRIITYLKKHRIERAEFVSKMSEKSEGNFMYLHYVLPEIESGAYEDLDLAAIPIGLQSYYEDHWQRMRGKDDDAWFDYKLPIITVLAVARKPISIALLSKFSKVSDRPRISSALEGWAQFLHKSEYPHEGALQARYSLYHKSFDDFIAEKDQLKESGVDLKKTALMMAKDLLNP